MISLKLCSFNVLFLTLFWAFGTSIPSLVSKDSRKPKDFILCRNCGTDIASADSIVYLRSPAASKTVNQSLFGLEKVFVQTLVNPLNVEFNILTVLETSCLTTGKDWTAEHSWFPGYAWRPCVCSRCGRHLGWAFEPLESADPGKVRASHRGFYALILDNTISEFYSDLLLVSPLTVTIR